MKPIHTLIAVFIMVVISCCNNNTKEVRFSKEAIHSLHLDSTRSITVSEKNGLTLDLNPFLKKGMEYYFGEMMQEIIIIPLETTDESILSEINQIIVTDSSIFIMDEYKGKSVVIFDKEGNFVARIEQGPGPGELFRHVNNMSFDTENNELIVFNNHFLSFFTPQGEFIRRERLPLNASEVVAIPDGYIFYALVGLYNAHISKDIEYQIFITDKKYKLLSMGFPYNFADDNNYEGANNYIDINGQNINFTFKFTNSIYQYVDNYNIRLKYTLDIKKGIPDILLKSSYNTLMSELENNDYYFFMGGYLESPTHDYFRLMNLYTRQYTYIYRDKKTGNLFGGATRIVDRGIFPQLNEPVSTYGKYFVSYSYVDEYINLLTDKLFPNETVEKLKSLTEDDNPVLILYKLQDF